MIGMGMPISHKRTPRMVHASVRCEVQAINVRTWFRFRELRPVHFPWHRFGYFFIWCYASGRMKPMTTGELARHLYNHLAYEVLMLRHAYQSLGTSKGLDFNMAIEAFALHARVLTEFLSEKPKSRGKDVRASQYAPGFKAERKDGIRETLDKLDAQITHFSRDRTIKPDEKFHTNLATELLDWVEYNVAKFNDALPPLFGRGWMPPGKRPEALPTTAKPSASNHVTTTTTYVTAKMNFGETTTLNTTKKST